MDAKSVCLLRFTFLIATLCYVSNGEGVVRTRVSADEDYQRVRRSKCQILESVHVSQRAPPIRPISRIRLALTGDSRSMRVSWSSPAPCPRGMVWARKDERKAKKVIFLAEVEQPYEFWYKKEYYRSQYFHHALITGLDAKSKLAAFSCVYTYIHIQACGGPLGHTT